MNISLEMDVVAVDERYVIAAPWLSVPVDAPSFAEAYFMARKIRGRRSR
jgi:hypothetical protein